ncbi:MAG: ABC transporter permease, partial [Desulfamplus sp.]|nr:ABC transporter permease [Desulfamplus sp.]
MSLEFFIAGKYLKAKRKEGFISLITLLSVAGVTVGVMALVIVIAVMSGAEIEFRKRILGVEPHILIMDYSGKFIGYKDAEKKIKEIKGVDAISPLVFGQTMIRSSSGLSGAVVRGIEPASGVSLIKGFTAAELEEKLGTGESEKKLGTGKKYKQNKISADIDGDAVNSTADASANSPEGT